MVVEVTMTSRTAVLQVAAAGSDRRSMPCRIQTAPLPPQSCWCRIARSTTSRWRNPRQLPDRRVRGRILYDFGGNACEGYSLEFRQVSETRYRRRQRRRPATCARRPGKTADAKSFKFNSQNYVDDSLVDTVDGHAEHDATTTRRRSHQAAAENLDLDAGLCSRPSTWCASSRPREPARPFSNFPVYDGSETGDKVFDTLTVIGRKIAPGERNHDDAAASEPKLAEVPRWPVTISYFDRGQAGRSGEQTPVYSIGFELYENGISRALTLDYGDFVVTGKMTLLEMKDRKPCLQ